MDRNRPTVVSRSDSGKWLGGVCAGIAQGRGIAPAWIRLAFMAGLLAGGLGGFVYIACWLIIPREGEQAGDASSGWLVMAAQVLGASISIVVLAGAAAALTLFGFGWVVLVLASVLLVSVLAAWPRLSTAWVVLPLAALTLPSIAVAAGGLRLSPSNGRGLAVPLKLTSTGDPTYRAGLGTMLVDLRRTALPASGVIRVNVDGGPRRTILALPANRCVYVELSYDIEPLLANLASELSPHRPFSQVDLFGRTLMQRSGVARQLPMPLGHGRHPGLRVGPVLKLHFKSAGGSLYVRDYPDLVNPEMTPDWPGYQVHPEPRPDIRGLKQRAAKREIKAWRLRRAREIRSMRAVDALMPGPCLVTGGRR